MASGDLRYVDYVTVSPLNAGQRTALANFLTQLWPGALTDVIAITCVRLPGNAIECQMRVEKQASTIGALPNNYIEILGKVP